MDALPRTPNGKVDRKALPAPGATLAVVADAVAFVAPRTPIETALAAIWREVLGVARVGVYDNFFHIGGHSLLAVQLIARIRQQFALDLPLTKLFQHPTIGALATLLQSAAGREAWSPLAPIQAEGTQTPFFCVHDISGQVHQFYPLAQALGTAHPFYGLQAVGVDGVATPLTSVEAMAAHYVAAIQTVQPHGPYLLGGYSLGCQIAFEMAHQLTTQGEEVALLVLLDGSAPTAVSHVAQPVDRVQWLLGKVEAIALWQDKPVPPVDEPALRTLSETEQWERLNQVLAAAELPRLEDDPLLSSYALFKANLELQYTPPAALAVPTVLFTTPRDVMPEPPDETLGWQPFFQQSLHCQRMPGNHFTLLQAPVVQDVAQTLADYLAQANS
ncbi:MAG: thioesterase domain-containing protein [Caldilineaceae bacterium]